MTETKPEAMASADELTRGTASAEPAELASRLAELRERLGEFRRRL